MPHPDQPTHQVTNPMKHKGKEASIEGSKWEEGQGHLGPSVVLWGPLVFRGVEFSGGELCSFQIPDGYHAALRRRNGPQCRKMYLIFQTPHQEGNLTAFYEGLSCPNTGFLRDKGLVELQSEMVFLFCIFLCSSVSVDEGLCGLGLRTHRHFKMQYKFLWSVFR